MAATYDAKLVLTDEAGNTKTLTGQLSDGDFPGPEPEPENSIDFSADFSRLPAGRELTTVDGWNTIFPDAAAQGVEIRLVKHSDIQHFTIRNGGCNGGNCLELTSPKGSYGMQRSTQLWLGKPTGAVNVEWDYMIDTTDGSTTNLFTAGGGKWGGAAIQWGPIQSGPTGGIRLMPVWPEGPPANERALTVAIQNQPDGRQWLQPPFYNPDFAPIEQGRWYKARIRMTGASEADPTTVRCEFWLNGEQKLDYTAHTDNHNAIAGMADVFIDICGFWGGVAKNAAPADAAQYTGEHFRVWVEA